MAFLYSSLPALHCPALIAIAITAKNGDSIINANKDITRSAPRLKISYKFMVLSLIEKRHCVNTQIAPPPPSLKSLTSTPKSQDSGFRPDTRPRKSHRAKSQYKKVKSLC